MKEREACFVRSNYRITISQRAFFFKICLNSLKHTCADLQRCKSLPFYTAKMIYIQIVVNFNIAQRKSSFTLCMLFLKKKKSSEINPIRPYSPVTLLLNKKPGSVWLPLRRTVLWVAAQSSASSAWAKTEPRRIRNGNDGRKKNKRKKMKGMARKTEEGCWVGVKESSTATQLINPGSGEARGWLNIPWTVSHLRFKTICSSGKQCKMACGWG